MNRVRFVAFLATVLVVGIGSRSSAVNEEGLPGSASRFIGAGVLRAKDSATHLVPIDVDSKCTFFLFASEDGFTIEASSPSGRTWNSRRDTRGGSAGHSEEPLPFLGGTLAFLGLDHPETGMWTVRILADAFADTVEHAAYQLKFLQDTHGKGPQLRVLVADSTRYRGDPLLLNVSLLEGLKPVPGALVAVEVGTDEGPGQSLRLLDDGKAPDVTARDGVFSGRLDRFAEAGLTTASFSAMRRGMEGQPDFERTAEIHFAVSESRSRLTGIIRDVPRDADGDGLNEYIVFVAGVDVTDATTLQLMGTVRDSEGREVWCGGERTPLEAGSHELELLCGTEGMTGTRSQTWFVLDSLALAESKSYATLDQTAPDYRTRPYSPGELLAEAIRVVDPGKATGVDLDRDGLFDMLDVEIPIDIRFPGNYLCTGSLDCGGVELADGQVRQDLVEGRNTLRLRFPGSCIASRDAKGRYKFADIYVGYYSETGDKRPRPRAGYILGGIWLEGGPPPSQFEPTPGSSPTKSGLAQREAYDCQ